MKCDITSESRGTHCTQQLPVCISQRLLEAIHLHLQETNEHPRCLISVGTLSQHLIKHSQEKMPNLQHSQIRSVGWSRVCLLWSASPLSTALPRTVCHKALSNYTSSPFRRQLLQWLGMQRCTHEQVLYRCCSGTLTGEVKPIAAPAHHSSTDAHQITCSLASPNSCRICE
jgi:hypothetical protein